MSRVEVEYRYDATVREDTVKELEDYTKKRCLADGMLLSAIRQDKKVKGKGKIAKLIVASRDKYTFLKEWKDNFPAKAGKAATYDQKLFCGVRKEGDDSQPYGKIESIKVDGKEVSLRNLVKKGKPLYCRDACRKARPEGSILPEEKYIAGFI